jgi:predicted dehydrogenase
MADEKTRIALIGAGSWGREHARIYSQHPDVDFCAVCGRTLERTKARGEEFDVRSYLDVGEMLEREKPDLVGICLPNKNHFQTTLQVIKADYPLFVEKPLVFKLEEADTLLAEAEERGLFFAINFNHRYARPVQMAEQAIREGRLGQITFATWRFGGSGGECFEHENLVETQCHGFDMLEHLCGPVESVAAQMTDVTGKGFSTLVVALRFASGAVGALIGSYDSSYAYVGTHLMEINGTQGRILIEDTVRRYTYQEAGSEKAEVWQAGYFNDAERQFRSTFDRHFNDLLLAFRSIENPPVHARMGRRALELATAAIRSFDTGRRVRL